MPAKVNCKNYPLKLNFESSSFLSGVIKARLPENKVGVLKVWRDNWQRNYESAVTWVQGQPCIRD